ncbi:hypothetical protein HYPSUDRAFT_70598 [Hypholoma sublateritium FD-334 SS-4]|uniref:Apple domain-containing protein n=1 Tax=Hypholoma sublateritium (strain FD-334 SS-4) TaxID=945553 RepID=A0A0D2NF21_HYPSF|nr:hypothetical protein HYPSUDRAFT_70598 [Hypholoma sublateritium FD-334 SS-4]
MESFFQIFLLSVITRGVIGLSLEQSHQNNARDTTPVTPAGFQLAFGPLTAATSAPFYMGFVSIDTYDVAACAALCKSRDPDSVGGACQFFNIWTPVVNGTTSTSSCSLYSRPTDASTATNIPDPESGLAVSLSRGYVRTSVDPNGGFESTPSGWTVSLGSAISTNSAAIAHTGTGVARLLSVPAVPATLAPAAALATVSGSPYVITFFEETTNITASGNATLAVKWNGNLVFSVDGFFGGSWRYHSIPVTAVGADTLQFSATGTTIAEIDVDDVYVLIA